MTAIFELLFKYRPLLYERGTIAFDPYWPPYVTWILLAGALAGFIAGDRLDRHAG